MKLTVTEIKNAKPKEKLGSGSNLCICLSLAQHESQGTAATHLTDYLEFEWDDAKNQKIAESGMCGMKAI